MDLIRIGIKLWLDPQISEHWPVNIPGRLINIFNWFKRPGIASALIPKEGIVHEWITSLDEVIIRMGDKNGIINLFEVLSNRILKLCSINESISRSNISLYSYDQYHWCPMALIVKEGLGNSSIMYRIFKDGKAIKISIKVGIDVQNNSISWFSWKKRLNLLQISEVKSK